MGPPALADRLRAFVTRIREETRIPGIAVAVSAGGQRAFACVGTAASGAVLNEHHRFHLGCATKLLLAAVTLELAERSELELRSEIGDVLTELRTTPHGAIRIAHLLSHTSGYRGTDISDHATRELSWTGLVDLLQRTPQHFAPGSVFSYEHSESVLLAEVVRRAAGRPGLALVQDMIFEPLGIMPGDFVADAAGAQDAGRHELDAHTGRFQPIRSAPVVPALWLPAFSRYTLSLAELITIAEALGGAKRRTQTARFAISDGALGLLRHPVVRLPPTTGGPLCELLPIAFGLGAARVRGDFCGSSGFTHGQCLGLRFDPATGLTVAVALNAMVPYLRDLVLSTVCRELTGRPALENRPALGFALEELAGRYRGPGHGIVDVSCTDDRLVCDIGRETLPERLRAELALDDEGHAVLRSPIPQLSLGFFRTDGSGDIGLMLGLHAYKRISRHEPNAT